LWREGEISINQSKILTKPHTGKEKPHPSSTTEGSKPCIYIEREVFAFT